MPPPNVPSLFELVETLRRSADASLEQSAAINRLTVTIDRLVAPFEQLRRDIFDIKNDREMDTAKVDLAIGKLNSDLQVILEGVRNAQGDVKTLSRDVTASHALPPRDERSTAERIIDRLERAPTATKLWVFALVIIIGIAFGAHLIIGAITGGG